MSMNQRAVRTAASAAVLLAAMALGSAQASTSITPVAGMFTLASGGAAEVNGAAPAQPQMADLVISAAGVASFDGPAAAGNTVLTFNVAPGALINALSFNLALTTVGESWQSEATIALLSSSGSGFVFSPGAGVDAPGTGTFSRTVLLSDLGQAFNVGADGLLRVEFYESFDDVTGAADANWTAGSITLANVGVVPEPGSYGLMALGLLAVVGSVRRKA